jgi:hypothetical protein
VHTEHLQNVKFGRVLGGWLVAIGVTSLILLTFAGLGLIGPEGASEGIGRSFLAVAVGFFVGGWFAAGRALSAPILHGVALGVMSIFVWFVINLVIDGFFPQMRTWEALTVELTVAVLLVQMAVAVVGALLGYNMAVRGRLSLSDSAPDGE